jgi:hypothetical protein
MRKYAIVPISTLLLACMVSTVSLKAETQSDSSNPRELLAGIGICAYPSMDELKEMKFSDDWLQVEALSPDDIDSTFSNLHDLAWLKPIAQDNKAILLGENHYYQVIHNLCTRILFALNTFDEYPLLVVEQQYSISGFLDYYVGLSDDGEARDFYEDVIYDFVGTEEAYQLLEHLRRWNRMFPEKRIHIGCHDVEHDHESTLQRIIVPYFQLMDSLFTIDLEMMITLDQTDLLNDLRNRLKDARTRNLIGAYPFLTPQYMECVIENLESLFHCHRYDFYSYRQRAMVRNLTDPRFLGSYLTNGKIVLWAGGYHTPTHFPYPDDRNFYKEGSYLSFDFEPTKGKTWSLRLNGFAYSAGEMAEVNLGECLHTGHSYQRNVRQFQKAYKQGLVSPEEYYLFDEELDDFDKLVFNAAYSHDHCPMLAIKMDWESIMNATSEHSPRLSNMARRIQDEYIRHDAHVYVPQSPITRAKPRRIAGMGAILKQNDEGTFVISQVIEHGPASEAGVKPRDRIIEVDGETVETWTLKELVARIRGKPGTEVRLKLHDNEKETHSQIETIILRGRYYV